MNQKKLSARILSLVLTVAMVFTMLPATALAAEGGTPIGVSSINTITSFDELGEGFDKSVPFDGHTYTLKVNLNTPFEDLALPTALGVTVERTINTTPPVTEETVDSGAIPEDITSTTAADVSEKTAEPVSQTTNTDATVSGNEPATPSDAEETPDPEDNPEQDKETTVTEVTQETIPVTWKGDRAYTPDQNSKVIYTAVLPEGYALKDGTMLPQIYAMVGIQARAATEVTIKFDARNDETITDATADGSGNITLPTPAAWSDYTFAGWYADIDGTGTALGMGGTECAVSASATVYAKWTKGGKTVRTSKLELTKSVTYVDKEGSEKTADPTKESITDTGEGWSWDFPNKTLTLSGMNIDVTSSSDEYGLHLSESTITLQAGTSNFVNAKNNFSNSRGLFAHYVNINGTGSFQAEGNGAGIFDRRGIMKITDATVTAIGNTGIYITSSLTLDNATVTATGGNGNLDIGISTGYLTILSGKVSAKGTTAISVSDEMTAADAMVTGATETFVSGEANTLTQSGADPVVITFGPSITVAAQSTAATYGTVANPTFALTNTNFSIGTYPAFAPSIVWANGSGPTGVTAAISSDKASITMNTTTATPVGEHKFRVVSAKTGGGNYESAEATLSVDQREATITWGTATSFPYNGKVQAPTATVNNKVGSDDVTVTVTGGQTIVGSYTATASGFAGAAAGNYKLPTTKPTQTFSITKGAYTGTQATAPDAFRATKTGTTVTLPEQHINGETVEYGYSEDADGTITWQDSTTFTALTANTDYNFFARVKDNGNHSEGETSTATKIRTDMSDVQKIVAAKTAVEAALNGFTATNATDSTIIDAVVKKALSDAGITGITPSWTSAFTKTPATESDDGAATGTITLTCGGASDTVALSKTIAQLPSDPAEKIAIVKAAIEAALNAYTATNATIDSDIKTIADKALSDSGVTDVTLAWGTPAFNNTNSTNSANGSVTGTFDLSCTTGSGATDKVLVNRPIERTDVQKLADAKAKAEAALVAMTATNDTTAEDVLTAVNNALSGTGATATWKTGNDNFNKTLATEGAAGNIKGKLVISYKSQTSEADVNLTIARLTADKTTLTTALADANNAKIGIAVNDNAPSSVANGTKFVSTAEMKALTDAIAAAQTVANNSTATTAEVTAAETALKAAVDTFNAAIKTGTYTSSGSGSTGGGSSTGGNTTPPVVVPPSTSQPNPPTTVETKVPATVDNKGNANVSITDKTMQDAIEKAVSEAKKNGTSGNGISIVINVTTGGKNANTVTVNLPKTVQEKVIAGKVLNTIVVVDRPDIAINMNLATITEINKQANADVQLSATRMDNSKLSAEAKTAIGNRPTFDLKATYANGSKSINSFGSGNVTIEIPYTLQNGEVASGLYAVYVDGNGKAHYLTNSSYDAIAKVLRFATNHFSIYGIGYKAPSGFTDITNHWAKSDIEFVVNRGLFSGTSATTFAPNGAMTRGMFVTALGRLANADVSSYKTSSFSDVKADAYYMGYVEWANKNGIVKGIGDGKFAPDQSITREQMAVIIESYAKAIGYTLPKVHAEKTFTDSNKIGTWAKDSVKKVQMAGIISGKASNTFDPQGTATRAEVSAVLHRFIELVISTDTAQGWMMNDSGKWMYYENGKAVTGSKKIGDESYTFDQYGEMATEPKNLTYSSYTVKKGDSFWKIALEQKCNMFELARINGKTIFSIIHPNDTLQIPQQ